MLFMKRLSLGLAVLIVLAATHSVLVVPAQAAKKVMPTLTLDDLTVALGDSVDLVVTVTTPDGDPIPGLNVFINIRGLDKQRISIPRKTDDEGIATLPYVAVGDLRPGRLSQTIRYSAKVARNREWASKTAAGTLTILASEEEEEEEEEVEEE